VLTPLDPVLVPLLCAQDADARLRVRATSAISAKHFCIVLPLRMLRCRPSLDTTPQLVPCEQKAEESRKTSNAAFIKEWHDFIKNPKRTTNDPMEAHYIGFHMWVKAVEKAGTTDPDKVIEALPGTQAPNLTGGVSTLLPNHHITKPVYIGEIRPDGQFNVVWKTKDLVPGAAWSPYLPGSKDLEADWVELKCGNFNKVTQKCGGGS
jgi:hypothetical protein